MLAVSRDTPIPFMALSLVFVLTLLIFLRASADDQMTGIVFVAARVTINAMAR
jgi:hypothetical protein